MCKPGRSFDGEIEPESSPDAVVIGDGFAADLREGAGDGEKGEKKGDFDVGHVGWWSRYGG